VLLAHLHGDRRPGTHCCRGLLGDLPTQERGPCFRNGNRPTLSLRGDVPGDAPHLVPEAIGHLRRDLLLHLQLLRELSAQRTQLVCHGLGALRAAELDAAHGQPDRLAGPSHPGPQVLHLGILGGHRGKHLLLLLLHRPLKRTKLDAHALNKRLQAVEAPGRRIAVRCLSRLRRLEAGGHAFGDLVCMRAQSLLALGDVHADLLSELLEPFDEKASRHARRLFDAVPDCGHQLWVQSRHSVCKVPYYAVACPLGLAALLQKLSGRPVLNA